MNNSLVCALGLSYTCIFNNFKNVQTLEFLFENFRIFFEVKVSIPFSLKLLNSCHISLYLQNRNSRNIENWDHQPPSSLLLHSSSTSDPNMLDVVGELRIVNEELMVSMEKSQNARKGEVGVLEEQIASLKEEKLRQKQNLMTRINEVNGFHRSFSGSCYNDNEKHSPNKKKTFFFNFELNI